MTIPQNNVVQSTSSPAEEKGGQRRSETRRIQRAKDKEPLIIKLTQGETPVFKEKWSLLIFAAFLGFNRKRRMPLGEFDSGRGIDQSIFSSNSAWCGILSILSLVERDDSNVLRGDPEETEFRLKLFEEYANGGLEIISSECEPQGYSLESFASLLPSDPSNVEGTKNPLADITI
jgi:dnd system-associated protein 4